MFLDRREHRSRSFSYAYMQLHALHDGNFRRTKCILRQTQQKDRRPRTDIKVSRRKSPLCCLIDRSVRRIIMRCDESNAISIAMVQKHQKIQPSLWKWSCEKWRTEGRKRDREAEIFGDREMSFSQTVTDINWQLDRQLLPLLFSFLFQSRTELVCTRILRKIYAHIRQWFLLIAFLADALISNTSSFIRPFLLCVLSWSWPPHSTNVGVPRFRTGLWSANVREGRIAHPVTHAHTHTFVYIVGLHKINPWISQLTDSKVPSVFSLKDILKNYLL